MATMLSLAADPPQSADAATQEARTRGAELLSEADPMETGVLSIRLGFLNSGRFSHESSLMDFRHTNH